MSPGDRIHCAARLSHRRAGWLGLLGLAAALFAGSCGAPPRPNFLLITADDLSCEDTTPYGNPHIRTPRLQTLASQGMRFDGAFLTSGSCSPSRCSTLTGRYPHSTGAGRLHDPLPNAQVTFLEPLRKAGYHVAIAGKWHFGKLARWRFDAIYPESDPAGYGDWIRALRERPRDRPFFLWLSASDPHRPYEEGTLVPPHAPDDVVVPPYLPDNQETRLDMATYYDAIGRLDQWVGRALDEVEREGIASNTFVLFLSDNGRPFPRCKPTLYDCGIRTPWIVRFPALVRPGSRTSSIVSAVDIAPTLLDVAGIGKPPTVQGMSFAPILRDPSAVVRERAFAEHNWHDYPARERMVRTARFKYIHNFYPDLPLTPSEDVLKSPTYHTMKFLMDRGALPPEQSSVFIAPRPREVLYDVVSDPAELVDLAGRPEYGGALREMRLALQEWEQETDDRDTLAPPASR